jgi:hypothetical protein
MGLITPTIERGLGLNNGYHWKRLLSLWRWHAKGYLEGKRGVGGRRWGRREPDK